MKVLVILQPTEDTKPEDLRVHVVEENQVVWELYKTDIIREMYFRGDGRESCNRRWQSIGSGNSKAAGVGDRP